MRLWLVRHAVVTAEALKFLYGASDVPVCEGTMAGQGESYAALAARLPRPAQAVITPLSRTRHTFAALLRAGYPPQEPLVEPAFTEQNFGRWQGREIAEFNERVAGAHPFWPIHAAAIPPEGERFDDLVARVGQGMEKLAAAHPGDVVVVSHGGAIRAACAFALGLSAHQALSLSVENISLTRLEKRNAAWRVISLNEQFAT